MPAIEDVSLNNFDILEQYCNNYLKVYVDVFFILNFLDINISPGT